MFDEWKILQTHKLVKNKKQRLTERG